MYWSLFQHINTDIFSEGGQACLEQSPSVLQTIKGLEHLTIPQNSFNSSIKCEKQI